MKLRIPTLILTFLLAVSCTIAESPADPYMGDWKGDRILADGRVQTVYAQILALGDGKYQSQLYETLDERSTPYAVMDGVAQNETVSFARTMGRGGEQVLQVTAHGLLVASSMWSGKANAGQFEGRFLGFENGSFSLNKYDRSSPTLGAEPPPGAVILFDGSNLKKWNNKKGQKAGWKIMPDGSMQVVPKTNSLVTKEGFGDQRLHVEFRTPFMPTHRGQKRGNSGVYVQGRYEIQVLDSYGLEGRDNECGGIYKISAPRVNACAPPARWQTYDITFRAARFDKKGKKTENARLTVHHNGILIHDDLELPYFTAGGVAENEAPTGPLMLQDHSDPVQYRNIWLENL